MLLRSLWTATPKELTLEVGKSVSLGRKPEIGITTLRCSRDQFCIELTSEQKLVGVRKGVHPSLVNGKEVGRDERVELKEGDTLELLRGRFKYQVGMAVSSHAPRKNANRWVKVADGLDVFTGEGCEGKEKIAGFDMDWTLIGTKGGSVFPKDEWDWRFLFSEVPGKLRKLAEEGYKIVVFTNQRGISSGKQSFDGLKRKIQALSEKIPAPIQLYVCSANGKYRKPAMGMWEELESSGNDGVKVDRSASFYCGDAAGREAGDSRKRKDFSCSDRLFAINLGVKFLTPEEFFLGKRPGKFELPSFDPRSVFEKKKDLMEPLGSKLTLGAQEIILMVGFPGSGKSTFVQDHLTTKGYAVINRDTLKSRQACLAACGKRLAEGKSVVIDNTNPDKESRKYYVDLAKEKTVPIRCFVLKVSKEHAMHNVRFRHLQGTDREHKDVNEMVVNSYNKKFEEPGLDEGFAAICRVNFVPSFEDAAMKDAYSKFLFEK